MSSRSDDPLGVVREVAQLVAASLGALSGRTVSVTQVVVHDAAQETTQAAAFLSQVLTPPPDGLALVGFAVDTNRYALFADPAAERCALARRLALDLADQVHEAEHGAPFPPCPGHRHPLTLTRPGLALEWVCPRRQRTPVATLIPACGHSVDPLHAKRS